MHEGVNEKLMELQLTEPNAYRAVMRAFEQSETVLENVRVFRLEDSSAFLYKFTENYYYFVRIDGMQFNLHFTGILTDDYYIRRIGRDGVMYNVEPDLFFSDYIYTNLCPTADGLFYKYKTHNAQGYTEGFHSFFRIQERDGNWYWDNRHHKYQKLTQEEIYHIIFDRPVRFDPIENRLGFM